MLHPLRNIRLSPMLLLSLLLGGTLLGSCASKMPSSASNLATSAPGAPEMANLDQGAIAALEAPMAQSDPAAQSVADEAVPQSLPQLVKTATLSILVESVDQSIDQTTAIALQQQGDILGLQNRTPIDGTRHTATVQIRVPQANLTATLQRLRELGTVQHQQLATEDVSSQLVDYEARLRNLRNTEAMLLKIMSRSGAIADVLKVAQELSNVRNAIEQLDAQLSNLRQQVSYSTISLTVEAAIAANVPERTADTQLAETWKGATHSLNQFTIDLLQLGIWLMVYSPYWLVLIGISVLGYRQIRRPRPTHSEPPTAQS